MLGTIDTVSFEVKSRPFKDVFLVVFFVFFGITVNLFTPGSRFSCLFQSALSRSCRSTFLAWLLGNTSGRFFRSGIEIWANTIGRGEFSIVITALYASDAVSGTIAWMVIVTSIIGAFVAKSSEKIGDILLRPQNPDLKVLPVKVQAG